MKQLIATLAVVAIAFSAIAVDVPVNQKQVTATIGDTNHILISKGNTIMRVATTNAFDQIKPTSPTFAGTVTASDASVTTLSAASASISGEVAAALFRTTGNTNAGAFSLEATNGVGVFELAVHKDLVQKTTNVIGLWELASASVVELDKSKGDKFNITNSITAATAIVATNFTKGQRLSGRIRGNASTSYAVTFSAHNGAMLANLNDYSGVAANTYSETMTNGNSMEFDIEMDKMNGTNAAFIVTRQYKSP